MPVSYMLIVDDDSQIRGIFRRLLSSAGHLVSEADGPGPALELLAASPFDLVVTDVDMGAGMNGLELTRRIKTEWGIPVIVMTGNGGNVKSEAVQAGADGFLCKPFSLPKALSLVEGVLRGERPFPE